LRSSQSQRELEVGLHVVTRNLLLLEMTCWCLTLVFKNLDLHETHFSGLCQF
jgi:hypothetical protein